MLCPIIYLSSLDIVLFIILLGGKLIDTLMASQWGEGAAGGGDSPHFTSRASAAQYCKRCVYY